MRGACVVHQDLEATEPPDGLRYRRTKRLGICTVGLDCQRLSAGIDDLLLKVVGCVRVLSIGERDRGAVGSESTDNAGADTASAPGDEGSPVCERGLGDVV
jgi:hypothetical protein